MQLSDAAEPPPPPKKASREALQLSDPLPAHLASPLPPSRRLHTSMPRSLSRTFAGLSGGEPSLRGTTSPEFISAAGGLKSTLQTGWLIFMSFGRCSRSLALPGNYPADQSTARPHPPRLPVLCGGSARQACCWAADAAVERGGGWGVKTAALLSLDKRRWLPLKVCLRSVLAPRRHADLVGVRSRSRPLCRSAQGPAFPPPL